MDNSFGLSLCPYERRLTTGKTRSGFILHLEIQGCRGLSEVAPLPGFSLETREDVEAQFHAKKEEILRIDWSAATFLQQVKRLSLLPSFAFGLEAALSSILCPCPTGDVQTAALLMGSLDEILQDAKLREKEGYRTAKLKVSSLSFEEAFCAASALKDRFRLRVDVNRAWKTDESLRFFSQFAKDAFDYVEEPFQNSGDLIHFTHPLAVDESFSSIELLEKLPQLKAIVYKPTVRGGLAYCQKLHSWTKHRNVSFILSSSFETELGLSYIANMARQLKILAPIGIGTLAFLSIPLK